MAMKKVLIADDVKAILDKERSFLGRDDVALFTAATNDDIVLVHKKEQVNLIISLLEMPGIASEELYQSIRERDDLRSVSVLLLCKNEPADIERSAQCKANAVMTLPVNAAELLEKAQQLLEISWRESYRVLLSMKMEGNNKDHAFFCRSENISTSGILIETDKVLQKGDRVRCSFFLPGSKQIKASGEIVRVMPRAEGSQVRKYGVKFSPLSAGDIASIESFVETKSQISTSRK